MKKHCSLPLPIMVCFLLVSLFLQSCGGSGNLPMEGEEVPAAIIITIEQEQEQGQESKVLPTLMPELWQYIFSYLDFEGVLAARSVSADWNKLITGFRQAGVVGVENKPSHIIDARSWIKREEINFGDNKLKELTPASIPSFAFFHLMGNIKNLGKELWPHLQETQVHTLNLGYNRIGAAGAIELAKALPGTQVHTLVLSYNEIGDAALIELAKALPATRVHILYLRGNQIGAAGASELAKALPATQVHTLYLGGNQIGAATQQLLVEQYPHIQWVF